ncbi:hypothetical protein GCM10011390_03480 [Aureimonas endophytica]|uniref:AP2/ERF domain-containing protein n=1 Tax=Aureimonas endophytica TaxID=2027858 RepID=A0A916ZCF7_9HYPH|nr:HNH endonuclease signature motif containing protein [Aureimonas endophytica]GGD88004.1 hypothetical protein GCM10011390_03480 [Aureimonas endophytica]
MSLHPKYDRPYAEIFAELVYDPATGHFTWTKPRRGRHPGRPAGYLDKNGYRVVHIDGVAFFAHRLAWFWTHGVWPGDRLDHKNGMPDDNRIANLREATAQQNSANRRMRQRNKSGYRGVFKATKGPSWNATITHDGRNVFIGAFATPTEAARAYDAAAIERHGEFAVLNFPTAVRNRVRRSEAA